MYVGLKKLVTTVVQHFFLKDVTEGSEAMPAQPVVATF